MRPMSCGNAFKDLRGGSNVQERPTPLWARIWGMLEDVKSVESRGP